MNYINRTGMRYGRLTVLGLSKTKPQKHPFYWECKCDCGNTKDIPGANLGKKKSTLSCGCYQKEVRDENNPRRVENFLRYIESIKMDGDVVARNQLLSSYKQHKPNFLLSEERFDILTKQNCYYCDAPPSNIRIYKVRKVERGRYIFSGIDRIKDDLGYFDENCISSCKTCNFMKKSFLFSDFINNIIKIVRYSAMEKIKHKDIPVDLLGRPTAHNIYSNYILSAEERHIPFNLTEKDFLSLTQQGCWYCGDLPYNIYQPKWAVEKYIYNGLDRQDTNLDYSYENCYPCCKVCNFMKRKLDVKDFLSHCLKIYTNLSLGDYIENTKKENIK